MKKFLVVALFAVGCGGPVYVPPEGEFEPIDPGIYNAVMTVTEQGCGHLPELARRTWKIRKTSTGGLYFYTEGIRVESVDETYFFGNLNIPKEPCDINIDVYATVGKTFFGFEGEVMIGVAVGGGACGSCSDHADIVGMLVVEEEGD